MLFVSCLMPVAPSSTEAGTPTQATPGPVGSPPHATSEDGGKTPDG